MTLVEKIHGNIKVDPKGPALAIDPMTLITIITEVLKMVMSAWQTCKKPDPNVQSSMKNPSPIEAWLLRRYIAQTRCDSRVAKAVYDAMLLTGKTTTVEELRGEQNRLSFDLVS